MSLDSIRREWTERLGRPEPKLICVGLNYRDHAVEQGIELPASPLLFAKTSDALPGDDDKIPFPGFAERRPASLPTTHWMSLPAGRVPTT
jgi:2-keto-4-pentenoate hydratase/2-oxohepta-3-ene-1,7-dioic acid hydratase in catechol pathway